jgi:hypothetical protein
MNFTKKAKISLLALSLLMIAGCKGAPGNEKPDDVLLKMQSAMQDRKDSQQIGSSNGTVAININSDEAKGQISLKLESSYDGSDINNPSAALKISADGSGNFEGTKGSLSVSGEIKMKENQLYAKLNDINISSDNNPEITQQVNVMAAFISGKWFKMPLPENEKLSIDPVRSLSTHGKNITNEQAEMIKKVVRELPLLMYVADTGSNASEYKYKVTLNKENIKKFVEEMAKIMESEISASDLANIEAFLSLAKIELDIAINAKTYEINEIKNGIISYESNEDEKGTFSVTFDGITKTEKTKLNAKITFNDATEFGELNFNVDMNTKILKSVDIEVPSDAVDIGSMIPGLTLPETIEQ